MQDTTNTLIFIAVTAWILQILLGWLQVSRFNKEFQLLCKKGNVGIGRSKGRFKPKVVIAIAFDQNCCVVDSIMIKGFSVFSQAKQVSTLQGLSYKQIDPTLIFPHSIDCQEALKEAVCLR